MSSSSSLTLSTLLSTLHTHLNAQTQLLPTLHLQLGLPQTALEDELQTLQHTLTKAVESQIEVRRKQVDDWIGKCEGVESGCARYSRALGTHAKVAGSLSDLKAEKVLPRRHESATVYQEKLRQIYHTKLEQLTTLTNRLNALARTLGSHFFPPDILTPALVATEELDNPTALRDVMPERFSKLEKELVRGKGEVLKRLNQLGEVFTQIDWLYSELGIDPPPSTVTPSVATSSSTLAVPRYSLPRSSSAGSTRLNSSADPFASSTIGPLTPTPSSLGKSNNHMLCPSSSSPQPSTALPEVPEFPNEHEYLRSLGRFIELLDSSPQDSSPGPILNSCGIEPTKGILSWAERLHAELNELKRRREVHIQAMYDQLEALWRRMGVGEEAMDGFVEANRGTTPPVVQAYEEELERMIDLKRERMGEFIANARTEIESLWEELMVGDDERNDFAAFSDDEHTEDLLSQHEHEIARLKAEVRLKMPMLTSIKKYMEICEEEKELERVASDQTRLLGRGGGRDPGRLLREEKMRKRVGKEKPKLEQQLLSSLPTWEQTHGRAFLVHGESMLQLLMENASANEQENRKRAPTSQYSAQALNRVASQSLKPAASGTNVAPKGGYVPGKSNASHHGVVTPAVRSGSSMSSYTHGTNKRQKLVDGTHHPAVRPGSPTRGRTPSNSALPRPTTQNAPPMSSQSKNSQGYAALGWGRNPSTMPRSRSQTSVTHLGSSVSSHHLSSTRSYNSGSVASSHSRESAAKKTTGRIRKESFKPRPSIDGGGGGAAGWKSGFRGMSVAEEDGC
ncbi:microtubule associated protein-domain-containing protein [Suillus clintonianus]|uniref:microtubule associated protein-domain-containing protein n=1 Tax=Suillus clintonianus TaxID=1904413 RepID=UPI001B88197A|nr:microtubule associated protein-domain-containing protein [Suillus clintonianus]KAG2152738.1 microtubule associated protein-domain-containing protein [Suillus clintonianus]